MVYNNESSGIGGLGGRGQNKVPTGDPTPPGIRLWREQPDPWNK